MPQPIRKDDLPHSGSAHCFDGHRFGSVPLSFFWTDAAPGTGPKLHRHPYPEIFIIQEGHVSFTVGDETVEATGGEIVIVPAGTPHKFVNLGPGRARHFDLHTSERMSTEWLEE
jgi:mannose-6-phosphate isomerase-like protein (cupin superfamily)